MTRWAISVIALLISAAAAIQAAGPASARDKGGGWITLFDGKNLDHWQGDGTANFQIANGSIMAVDKKDPKAVASYLVSKETYKDFELRAEFWVSNDANSGIYIRVTDPANISSKSAYEANIFDTRPETDGGTGALANVAKVSKPFKAGGKWNTYVVVAKGSKFTLTLNGEKTVDGAEDSKFPEGKIALQFGKGVVMFRKVAIRPL
jgi:hypothetical protein